MWHFVLESTNGDQLVEAADAEHEVCGERLELLAVVRGLEALDQPSRVTLVTPSRYVSRGLRYGLEEWRRSNWQWERFGRLVPVKNGDLWQRVDRALEYHHVDCRTWPPRTGDDDPEFSPVQSEASEDRLPRRTLATSLRAAFGGLLRSVTALAAVIGTVVRRGNQHPEVGSREGSCVEAWTCPAGRGWRLPEWSPRAI